MRLKELNSLLQDVEDFTTPKQELEQYITGASLASRLLYTVAEQYESFEEVTVLDLGCGTGMLGIGCAFLGCPHVTALDVDGDALQQAASNAEQFEGLPIDFVQADVGDVLNTGLGQRLEADVVVSNPPFGAWCKGADSTFLCAAFKISRSTVYSLHKSSTRSHIQRLAQKTLRASSASVIAEVEYDLPATYKHHKHKSKDIQVDLWRFEVSCEPTS